MLTTETKKVEYHPLYEVQNRFDTEINSGELLEKLTKKVHQVFNSSVKNPRKSKNKIIVSQFDIDDSLKLFYSFDRKVFEFYTKFEFKQRLEKKSTHKLIFDDLLLIDGDFKFIEKNKSQAFEEVFLTSLKNKVLLKDDFNSLKLFVDKNLLTQLIPSFYQFLLGLREIMEKDWFLSVRDVNTGNFPLRLLDEHSIFTYVESLFFCDAKQEVSFNQRFFSRESCKRLKKASKKSINELVKSKDLGFKLNKLSDLKSQGFISALQFFDCFNDTIENDLKNFHYKFNLELGNFGGEIVDQVLEMNLYNGFPHFSESPFKGDEFPKTNCSVLKRFKTDNLVRCLKNLELVNSLRKDDDNFLYLSLLFYLELESRNVDFRDYPEFKVSFWFLMKLLEWTKNDEFELLRDVDLILYKTDVLDVLDLLSIRKRKTELEDLSDSEELYSIRMETFSFMKANGFRLAVPNEFYSNLELFVKMVDSGFSATETGVYETVSKKLLKLFQKA